MFYRKAVEVLSKWAAGNDRKPLIIRGARQVGKTTLVNQFASRFDQYISLNLELPADRQPFEEFQTVDLLLQTIFFIQNKPIDKTNSTLLFIDEIQEVPEALNILRYLYEQAPHLHVIAAGSVLESLFNQEVHFPVGRVTFLMLRPVSFPEFLSAMEENAALEQLLQIPVQSFAHEKLLQLFHVYTLIGGMPEVVNHYVTNRDLVSLRPIYDSLISSYLEDVEKYAAGSAQAQQIRHAIETSFLSAGNRIKFEGFGQSSYRSREMSEALRIAEKALLLQLVYPTTSATLPLIPAKNRSPRLQVLDTGLMNYRVGIQHEIFGTPDLASVYQGKVVEHITGQELLAFQFDALSELSFWVREKTTSSAEVDFIFPFRGKLIPVEVKSGASGSLKSLHTFMDLTPHDIAIRFCKDLFSLDQIKTPNGKNFTLLNIPYYAVSQIEGYLDWIMKS